LATRIRLKRMGKKFYAFYRIVVVDQRKKRDGEVIEQIGTYDPNTQPSTIHVKSDRAQHWLSVGAQPSDAVLALFKVTGDWQTFKHLPGAEGHYKEPAQKSPAAEAIEKASNAAQKIKADKAAKEEKAKKEAAAKAAAAKKDADAKAADSSDTKADDADAQKSE
jgi:small subunit ribosomal protein S16